MPRLLWVLALAPGLALTAAGQSSDLRIEAVSAVITLRKPAVVKLTAAAEHDDPEGPETFGAGFVIDPRGYLLTVRHVVAGHRQVKAQWADGTWRVAAVLLEDAASELAVLKVDADGPLDFCPLAPMDNLLEGQEVVVLGHPYRYDFTASRGIVSALHRTMKLPNGITLTGLVQTDAAINPGNSGGIVCNLRGEVVGTPVALRGGAAGLGFAVEVGAVKRLLHKHFAAQRVAGIGPGWPPALRNSHKPPVPPLRLEDLER